MIDPHASIALSVALFGLGVLGVFTHRQAISMLLSLQIMLAASVLALVSFDRTVSNLHNVAGHSADGAAQSAGQGFGLLILTIAIAQVAVGLGLLLSARGGREQPQHRVTDSSQW